MGVDRHRVWRGELRLVWFWQVNLGVMCLVRRGVFVSWGSRGLVFGVAVLGRRRPGQPRLPRDPPCA